MLQDMRNICLIRLMKLFFLYDNNYTRNCMVLMALWGDFVEVEVTFSELKVKIAKFKSYSYI